MKTHMHNTIAKNLDNDIVSHTQFINHQQAIHSNVKPIVNTRRKQQYKVHKNDKVELNTDPEIHMRKMFKNLHDKDNYKSNIDNKNSYYHKDKQILKDKIKKNKYQNYAKSQHQRQLRHMQNRIANCKNITVRKKDKTDPITNPTYFIRPADKAQGIGLSTYTQKILSMNKNRSYLQGKGLSSANTAYQLRMSQKNISQQVDDKYNQSYGSIPNYSNVNKGRPMSAMNEKNKNNKNRPHTANNRSKQNGFQSDLPNCTFRDILNHIVDNKIYKDTDLKVLYVRLCHKYQQPNIEQIWQSIMDEMES